MKKKILALAIAAIMVVTALASLSLAYLMDTDEDTNTFTVGNVQIRQDEQDREGKAYGTDSKKFYPIINDSVDADGYHHGANYIDKFVTVTNTGNEDAYIRTHIAFPAALDDGPTTFDANANILHWNAASAKYDKAISTKFGTLPNAWYWGKSTDNDWPGNGGDWNSYQTTVDGILYNVYVVTHATKVAPYATTAPSLFGVYLDKYVNWAPNENGVGGYYFLDKPGTADDKNIDFDLSQAFNILVISEAVQAEGWGNDANAAFTALDQAFGAVGTYCPFGGTVGAPLN